MKRHSTVHVRSTYIHAELGLFLCIGCGRWCSLLSEPIIVNSNTRPMPSMEEVQVDPTAASGVLHSPISQDPALGALLIQPAAADEGEGKANATQGSAYICPAVLTCVLIPISKGRGGCRARRQRRLKVQLVWQMVRWPPPHACPPPCHQNQNEKRHRRMQWQNRSRVECKVCLLLFYSILFCAGLTIIYLGHHQR